MVSRGGVSQDFFFSSSGGLKVHQTAGGGDASQQDREQRGFASQAKAGLLVMGQKSLQMKAAETTKRKTLDLGWLVVSPPRKNFFRACPHTKGLRRKNTLSYFRKRSLILPLRWCDRESRKKVLLFRSTDKVSSLSFTTRVFWVNTVLFPTFYYFISLADNYRHRVYAGRTKDTDT